MGQGEFKVHIQLKCLECPTEFTADAYSTDALTVATEFLTNHRHKQPVIVDKPDNEGV